MLLDLKKSICERNAKIIVSKDTYTNRKHLANNRNKDNVRQYQLDGKIIKQEKSCDFLVLNDDKKKAFFIELKGSDVSSAIPQLEGALNKVKNEILDYKIYFRIISSKTKTHEVRDSKVIAFKKKYGSNSLVIKTQLYEEDIN